MSEAVAASSPRWTIVVLQLVLLYLAGLRLWFDITVSPMGDEAYYWMWGQRPDWSYFDHAPLHAWLQGIVAGVFGWSNFSVRLLTWLTTAGSLWILWLWAHRLAPADPQSWFWHTAVLYFATPVVAIVTGIALHDHLLLFWVLASAFAFHAFAESAEVERPDWRILYLAAALLGLAVLTKYNGVFLGIGYAIWMLARPSLRRLLRTPHPWLAAMLAIAMQAPVLYWNLSEGLAGFRFHLAERPSLDWTTPRPAGTLAFLGAVVLAMSPVLFAAALRLPWLRVANTRERLARGLAGSIYFSAMLLWCALALYVQIYFHWSVVAVAALVPVLHRLLGSRIAMLVHVLFGLYVATFVVITYAVTPLAGPLADRGAPANYGWPDLAARVEAARTGHPGSFLAATRYTYAAQLGFQLGTTDIAAFNPIRSQYDYWWDAANHAGQDAIIIADRAFPIDAARTRFADLERIEAVPVTDGLGEEIWSFEIWLGRDFQPPPLSDTRDPISLPAQASPDQP